MPKNNLEKVVADICHDCGLEIEPKGIEGCHCLLVSQYSSDSNKRVIIKFVNRKHPEALLRNNKTISSKDFPHLNVHGKVFVSASLCPYYQYIWGLDLVLPCTGFKNYHKITIHDHVCMPKFWHT